MSLPEPGQTGCTIEDWAGWDGRWELIHGVPYAMTPSPGFEHQRISVRLITGRGIEGIPDLVVEILSPSTALRDLDHKRFAYEAAGVPEYLIVNPDEKAGVLLHLVNGRYEEAFRAAWGAVVALLGNRISVVMG
jgi:Uma2 family endonuclease